MNSYKQLQTTTNSTMWKQKLLAFLPSKVSTCKNCDVLRKSIQDLTDRLQALERRMGVYIQPSQGRDENFARHCREKDGVDAARYGLVETDILNQHGQDVTQIEKASHQDKCQLPSYHQSSGYGHAIVDKTDPSADYCTKDWRVRHHHDIDANCRTIVSISKDTMKRITNTVNKVPPSHQVQAALAHAAAEIERAYAHADCIAGLYKAPTHHSNFQYLCADAVASTSYEAVVQYERIRNPVGQPSTFRDLMIRGGFAIRLEKNERGRFRYPTFRHQTRAFPCCRPWLKKRKEKKMEKTAARVAVKLAAILMEEGRGPARPGVAAAGETAQGASGAFRRSSARAAVPVRTASV